MKERTESQGLKVKNRTRKGHKKKAKSPRQGKLRKAEHDDPKQVLPEYPSFIPLLLLLRTLDILGPTPPAS
jgi:hypothetical protein